MIKIIFFVLITTNLFAQKQFAPLGAVWNYEGHEINCEGNHIQYKVENEVLIDSKDCSIIYSYKSNDLDPDFQKTNDSLIVWENEGQIYFLEDTSFYLLFDFDVENGDTIVYYDPINKNHFSSTINEDVPSGPKEFKIEIKNIETKIISNEELRFYSISYIDESYLDCFHSEIIIENIGSSSQKLVGDCTLYVADGCFGGLQCYDNGEIQYETNLLFESYNPACDFVDFIQNEDRNILIDIFPNPFNSGVQIDFKGYFPSNPYLDIFNFSGKNVSRLRIDQSSNLDLNLLNPGVYYFEVRDGKDVIHRARVVKID